jgi:hypothetical protein
VCRYDADTICYLLAPLKQRQDAGKLPAAGLTVVSLFDGVGGLAVVGGRGCESVFV